MLNPFALRKSTAALRAQNDRLEQQNNKNNETPNGVIDEAIDTEPDNQMEFPWLDDEERATVHRIMHRIDMSM